MTTTLKQTVAAMLVRGQDFGVFIDLVDSCRLEVACDPEIAGFDWTELIQKHRAAIVELLRHNESAAAVVIQRILAKP